MENVGSSTATGTRPARMERAGCPAIDNTTSPLTPGRTREEDRDNYQRKIRMTIDRLCYYWGLGLPQLSEFSPAKQERTIRYEIVVKIKFLCAKGEIDPLVEQFETEAEGLYTGWVLKPKAERGLRGVPEKTRQCHRPISEEERTLLLGILLRILTARFDVIKTPSKPRFGPRDQHTHTFAGQVIDSSSIPFALSPGLNDSKRSRDAPQDPDDPDGTFKKPKLPERTPDPRSFDSRSAQTSFSTVFSHAHLEDSSRSLPEVFTQETIPTQTSALDESGANFDRQAYREQANTSFQSNTQSSEYEGASSFDAAIAEIDDSKLVGVGQSDPVVDDELSQDLVGHAAVIDADIDESILGEDELRLGLQGLFPELPRALRGIPLRAGYEIVRVFLHTGVPLETAVAPSVLEWGNYDQLWQWLRSLALFHGKQFPRRSSQEAWDIAGEDGFQKGSRAVYPSGSLRFNSQSASPLFRLHLNPLILDKSHRTGRRFGHDRLFEIDIPSLTGQHVPEVLRKAGTPGREMIVQWLVDKSHHFLGKSWQSFHLKESDKDKRKKSNNVEDVVFAHRIFFFAVDGVGFKKDPFPADPLAKPYVRLTVESLLNSIRPTRKNGHQSYLKLFVRTSLALSRNVATVVLEKHQIRYKSDIECEGIIMTDGAGRISPSLAFKVGEKLGLTFRPSAFQGRIGDAKGLWVVCWTDTSQEDWIEIYASQRKWKPSTKLNGESDDPSHRTLEVLAHSKPLKSADLNLQLIPLLMNGANDPVEMRKAIGRLLENGLTREVDTLQAAMENAQSFRQWVRQVKPSTQERLRNGGVAFQGGLPSSVEERLNLLLDAGFEVTKLSYMKDMTKTVFNNQFEDLQTRLNITIGKSTNLFMVPDFAGVLEEGEICMDFSHFVDEISGFSGHFLNGVEVLVARNPAHLVSDIQKVRAVFKVELMGLKDLIVFSTKGRCLAEMLSGGDYDGDKAWVCWEPTIVDNFTSVDVPVLPDLVQEGYLRKDTTTYDELVGGQTKPISIFLKKSFSFTMQPNLLGICTSHKEAICYDVNRVDTDEAISLSTLVNALVDASKQGYTFVDEDWARFKADKVKTRPLKLSAEDKFRLVNRHAKHVFDYLKWVARETIDLALGKFHESLPNPPTWDKDLTGYYSRALDLASREPQWARLLEDLKTDIQPLKNANSKHSTSPFVPYIMEAYEEFLAIVPHETTLVSQTLLLDTPLDPELSSWALLKASYLFASYGKKSTSKFPWHLAGKQLCALKAKAIGGMFAVVPSMYAMSKPDNQYVKALLCKEPLTSFGDEERVADGEVPEEIDA